MVNGPLQKRGESYRLSAGRYELVSLEHNRIFRSTVLEGFWLDVEWLLAEPLPNEYEKLLFFDKDSVSK